LGHVHKNPFLLLQINPFEQRLYHISAVFRNTGINETSFTFANGDVLIINPSIGSLLGNQMNPIMQWDFNDMLNSVYNRSENVIYENRYPLNNPKFNASLLQGVIQHFPEPSTSNQTESVFLEDINNENSEPLLHGFPEPFIYDTSVLMSQKSLNETANKNIEQIDDKGASSSLGQGSYSNKNRIKPVGEKVRRLRVGI